MRKLLSFQPYPLYIHGGGSRVLRRLYQGYEDQVISVAVWPSVGPPRTGAIKEIIIPLLPVERKWMRWHLRRIVWWLRMNVMLGATLKKVRQVVQTTPHDVLHIVNHGPFSGAFCHPSFRFEKPLWVSFHDYFSTTGSSRAVTEQLWQKANRRLVISEELGAKYQQLFGAQNFEVITDGVTAAEVSSPATIVASPAVIYFAGSMHIEYLPLVKALADTLDMLVADGLNCKFVLRGVPPLEVLANRSFETEYRSNFLTDEAIKHELDTATILYLPMRLDDPDFYLYSLSTKMISYLGGSGTILYHGPAASAACSLLQKSEAAVTCCSLATDDLRQAVKKLLLNENSISANAKILAKNRFLMSTIQKIFWQK